ncbi:MAG: PIN domain-containing protein [Akkermansiaceae bacterium]|nr:PIN domain-containing protein [Akkermansiaceae bacterium]
MTLFDVNVLIYAHREDQVSHDYYREHVEGLVNASGAFGLSTLVAVGFVRIVTHPGFPNGPTPLSQALAVIDALASLNHCHWIAPGRRHWELTSQLCRKLECTGKAVADAQHAAVAIEHACRWVTRDRDFRRFTADGLKLELLEPGSA